MINTYVQKLANNLPPPTSLQRLDLVLDGGAFNGSYLVGALYFLKELEARRHARVERISGCSIGSLVGLLYWADALDAMPPLYQLVQTHFRETQMLQVLTQLKTHVAPLLPPDICARVHKKLYVCYHDIKKQKKIVRHSYKNVDDLLETVLRSCFVPGLVDGSLLYKGRYLDGLNAHLFAPSPGKKVLHMELFGYDKASYSLNIKNEQTNFHRILSGLLDLPSFFIKQSSTPMCSYVDEWSLWNQANYQVKLWIERVIVCVVWWWIKLKPHVLNTVPCKGADLVAKLLQANVKVWIEVFCL
jgi:hypothetical protein